MADEPAPLRKVIREEQREIVPGTVPRVTRWVHVLECGHVLPEPSDIYGRRNAARRRCRKCAQGRPADPT